MQAAAASRAEAGVLGAEGALAGATMEARATGGMEMEGTADMVEEEDMTMAMAARAVPMARMGTTAAMGPLPMEGRAWQWCP